MNYTKAQRDNIRLMARTCPAPDAQLLALLDDLDEMDREIERRRHDHDQLLGDYGRIIAQRDALLAAAKVLAARAAIAGCEPPSLAADSGLRIERPGRDNAADPTIDGPDMVSQYLMNQRTERPDCDSIAEINADIASDPELARELDARGGAA